MIIIEQVEKLMNDMDILIDDLVNTDTDVIDKDQLIELRAKCVPFGKLLTRQIERIEMSEEE